MTVSKCIDSKVSRGKAISRYSLRRIFIDIENLSNSCFFRVDIKNITSTEGKNNARTAIGLELTVLVLIVRLLIVLS